jgi:hypothetical protein
MGFKGFFKGLGKAALKVAPFAAMAIPGIGPLAAMGIRAATGAASGALGGGGWKGALLGGGLSAIPGGGAGGAAAGGAAKVGLKELAKGLTKGALQNFATGTATGLATGQGLKGALKGGGQAAGAGGVGGAGGVKQALTTGAKQVAQNVGGHYAGQALQKAGVPGALAQQGGNVFSNYLGNQFQPAAAGPKRLTTGGLDTGAGPFTLGGSTDNFGQGIVSQQSPGWPTAGRWPATPPYAGGWAGGGAGGGPLGQGGTGPTFPYGAPGGGGQQPGQVPQTQRPGQMQWPGMTVPPDINERARQANTPPGGFNQNAPTTPGGGGFWQKWGPTIMQGAGAGVGALAGQWATRSAMNRSPEEQLALGGQQQMAGGLGQEGYGLMRESRPFMSQAGNYYQTLLRGNRAAMAQAVAGPTAQLTDVYRGAERGLERSGVRGAARDVATADLNRERASKIAGLTTGMQPYAAEQLGTLGQNMGQLGAGMAGTAGNIYGNLLNQGQQNRGYGRQEGEKAGKGIGSIIADIGKIQFGGNQPQVPGSTPQPQAPSPQPKQPNITTQPIPPRQRPPGQGPAYPPLKPPVLTTPGGARPPSSSTPFPGRVIPPALGGGGYPGQAPTTGNVPAPNLGGGGGYPGWDPWRGKGVQF